MTINLTRPEVKELPEFTIILASQSIGRRMLLEKLGIWFQVVVPHIDEDSITHANPDKMISERSRAKIEEIVKHPHVYALSEEQKYVIIAADSMAVAGKKAYGKAKDKEEAKEILKNLSGRSHMFTTAVDIVLLEKGSVKKEWSKVVKTKVTFNKISKPDMDSYVERYDLRKYAGCYALNETPWTMVKKIEGSYTNVIGLPFEVVIPVLRSFKLFV